MKKLVDSGKIRVADATVDDIVDSQMRRNAFGDFAYAYAKYVKDNGGFCPDLKGPNFKEACLISQKMVKSFHSSLILKRQLQQTGKYKKLWWRKATIELPKLSWRYIRWFLVKSLSQPLNSLPNIVGAQPSSLTKNIPNYPLFTLHRRISSQRQVHGSLSLRSPPAPSPFSNPP